ncbi:MAG: IclR family transcriptional regulator [Gammaproteobacteria bacterium]
MSGTERTLDLIEAFRDHQGPLLLTELCERLSVSKSTAFELVRALTRRGYLYSLGRRRGYYPTGRLLANAEIIAAHDPVAARLEPAMTRLRDTTGETVIAGKRDRDTVVYLAVVEGNQTIRYTTAPGDLKPLHSSAIGKAFLAADDAPTEATALERYTARTICDPARLAQDLARGRRRGYQLTRGENVADVMALARLADLGGDLVGLAVAGPMARMRANEAKVAAALATTVSALEASA